MPGGTALTEEERGGLDAALAALADGGRAWAGFDLAQRARLLRRTRNAVAAVTAEWATTAAESKGVGGGHPLRGEEWLSGPYAVLGALDAYATSLEKLAAGGSPLDGVRTGPAPGGRLRVDAFPLTRSDRALLAGYRGEVWLRPGSTREEARREAGLAQLAPAESGGVGLVLGAGNVTAIPVLDVLTELIAHNRVVLLKVNPTQDVMVPVLERALAPLTGTGLLRIVRGSGETGGYLSTHPDVAHVHITGAARTFDAIVWGDDAARREDGPLLTTPITAELGGVSPVIVVPGEWTEADLRFHAEHVVTMRLQNSGHNCIAGQVVLLSADWPQREAFLTALREAYAAAPDRPVWYPNGERSLAAAAEDYPGARRYGSRLLVEVGSGDDPAALERTEYFGPVLGVVSLPGTGRAFLDTAIAHANDRLEGNLGANVLIDPGAARELGDGFERAIAELRYGTIAVNTWSALGFLTPTLPWGAYPGGTLRDVGSGIGTVHNALLLDRVERAVVRGPFRPFPRSLTGGGATVLPKPPWFVSARTGAEVSEGLTRFRATGGAAGLARTLAAALRA